MGKQKLKNKVEDNYQGIFKGNAFESTLEIQEGNRLPKIITKE